MLGTNGFPSLETSLVASVVCGYQIVPAQIEHVYELARTMREADREEIAGSGNNPKAALWRGYRNSIICEAAIIDSEVAAIWGLSLAWTPGVSPLSDLG